MDDLESRVASLLNRSNETFDKLRRNTGRRPYYNLSQGQAVRKILEAIIAAPDKIQRIPGMGVKLTTIRQQWYQGVEYVLDNLDKDNRYKQLTQNLRTKLDHGYLTVFVTGANLVPLQATPMTNHRMNLENFIETAEPGDKFPDEQVLLSDEDVMELSSIMLGLEELFDYHIDRTTIKVIRK